jgi:hypothetical protein
MITILNMARKVSVPPLFFSDSLPSLAKSYHNVPSALTLTGDMDEEQAEEDPETKKAEEEIKALIEYSKGPVSYLRTWKYFNENVLGFKCSLCPEIKLLGDDIAIQHLYGKIHKKREKELTEKNRTKEEIEALRAKNIRKKEKRLEKAGEVPKQKEVEKQKVSKRKGPEASDVEGSKRKKGKPLKPQAQESSEKATKKGRVRPGKKARQAAMQQLGRK